jgi:MoaA/NifB/PqqE/SkfB family radical SAM enzyme
MQISYLGQIIRYKLAHSFNLGKPLPDNITISITRACQSACLTCDCGRDTREGRVNTQQELSLEELYQIINGIDWHVRFLTISGGEPSLAGAFQSFAVDFANRIRPDYVTIPTNALTSRLLNKIEFVLHATMSLRTLWHVNVSVDGLGANHDQLRGVEGNFGKCIEALEGLLELRKRYPNLRVGVHTVVSKYNVGMIPQITNYFKQYPLDNHISEIAEERYELGTMGRDITPCDQYANVLSCLKQALGNQKEGKLRRALRLAYYGFVEEWCEHQNHQPVPCMAGIASAHITETGKLVSCCTRWSNIGLMGDLREYGYDFRKAWFSEQAYRVRASIRSQECACPLASAAYSSLLCSPKHLLAIAKRYIT